MFSWKLWVLWSQFLRQNDRKNILYNPPFNGSVHRVKFHNLISSFIKEGCYFGSICGWISGGFGSKGGLGSKDSILVSVSGNFGDSLMTARKQYFHNSRVRSELLGQSFEFNCLFVACYSCFGSQFDKTTRLLCFYSCITQKEWTKKQRAHAIYIMHYVLNIRIDTVCLNE